MQPELMDIPRFKGGKKGSLFRYESPEQWGGEPISPRAGDVALRVFDREKRRPVGEGVTVHFRARGAEWSFTKTTDAEGFAYAEDAPSVPIEATVEYGSRPTVLLHPSLTQTGRFRAVMAGGSMDTVAISGWDLGAGRKKVQIRDRHTDKPIPNLRVWFMTRPRPGTRTLPWQKKVVTDSEGYAMAEGLPLQQIFVGIFYNGKRHVHPLVANPYAARRFATRHPDQYPPIYAEGRHVALPTLPPVVRPAVVSQFARMHPELTPEQLKSIVDALSRPTHAAKIGDTMVVGSRYMGITPEAADLYPLVNGHERAAMSMGITPEANYLYPLIDRKNGTRVDALPSQSAFMYSTHDRMRGTHLGQKDISYIRVQTIDRNGNPITGVRVLVPGVGEMNTGPDGVATLTVPGVNPGSDRTVFVALPEDTANPLQIVMKTSTLSSTPLIVRSLTAAGTTFITTAEVLGAVLGLSLLSAATVFVKKEADARPILFSIGGSISAAAAFSFLSRKA